MICPDCGDEYHEGIAECADCHVPLVAGPPTDPEHPDITLVTVLSGRNEAQLVVAKSLLTGAGIPFVVKTAPIGHLGFIMGSGGFEIQVSAEDRESAEALLGDEVGGT